MVVALVVDQFQPVDGEIGVRAELNRGPPLASLAHVELGAEKANDDIAHRGDPFG